MGKSRRRLVEARPNRNVLDFAGLASDAAAAIPATAEQIDELIELGMTQAAIARLAAIRGIRRTST
jgi:hypothetical protein